MLNLHVVQADYGDCLLLEYKEKEQEASKFILVDGGPTNTYADHLQHVLKEKVGQGGHLDLVVVSHIDNDHICGIINFLQYLKLDVDEQQPLRTRVDGLWHNTFRQNIAFESPNAKEVVDLATEAENRGMLHNLPLGDVKGFSQGEQTARLADDLHIAVNSGFKDNIILSESNPDLPKMGKLKIWILGPNRRNLERLQKKWWEWLQDNVKKKKSVKGGKDTAPPNLSSIMLLAEEEGGRTILLPGDGTDTEILAGLQSLEKKLAIDGIFHVEVLKVPHHGSRRNVSPEFFEKVTADVYVISANDKDKNKNPDLATLEWIVSSAEKQHRSIKILATNETESIKKLKQKYGQKVDGLSGKHYATV